MVMACMIRGWSFAMITSGDGVEDDMRKELRSPQNNDQVHRVAPHLLPHCLQEEVHQEDEGCAEFMEWRARLVRKVEVGGRDS